MFSRRFRRESQHAPPADEGEDIYMGSGIQWWAISIKKKETRRERVGVKVLRRYVTA